MFCIHLGPVLGGTAVQGPEILYIIIQGISHLSFWSCKFLAKRCWLIQQTSWTSCAQRRRCPWSAQTPQRRWGCPASGTFMSFPIQICDTDSVQIGCNIIVIFLVPGTLRRAHNLVCLFYRPSILLKKTNNSCTQRVKIVVNLGVIDLLNELLCNLAQLGLLDVVHHHRQHGQQLVLGKLTQRGSLLFALVLALFWLLEFFEQCIFLMSPHPLSWFLSYHLKC